jgi:hypothetical protein
LPVAAELPRVTRGTEAIDKLNMIVTGLKSERNACWPTVKPWSKKERDEAIPSLAQQARALLRDGE